jgi:tRNA-splicing ligase RtcB
MNDSRLHRLDAQRVAVRNDFGVPATLFANDDVPIEAAAVDELQGVLGLSETVATLSGDYGVERVALTPDFHKGAGIPIGTVLKTVGFAVPAAIGNDINCGMRLHTTGLAAERVRGELDAIEHRLRNLYFEGGRSIPMTRTQRTALFREGLVGLKNSVPKSQQDGLWRDFHRVPDAEHERVHHGGSMQADATPGLDDFLGPTDGSLTRDGQIGSIGGGNHFVELQEVRRILDGPTAHAWDLKPGQVTVMVHSGSLGVGGQVGTRTRQLLQTAWPAGVKQPASGILPLPAGAALDSFWTSMSNAANFAFANRLFLALMALRGLADTFGEFANQTLYDAPHNLVWRDDSGGVPTFLHRKGACPSRGFEAMAETPFAYHGEPVLVPGSMGASSFILAGRGHAEALESASHGAGRQLSRGRALKADDAQFRQFLRDFRVVTPIDLNRPDVKHRRDIVEKKLVDLKKEAPFAYKGIGPVIETLTAANLAQPVAELTPLLTVKA